MWNHPPTIASMAGGSFASVYLWIRALRSYLPAEWNYGYLIHRSRAPWLRGLPVSRWHVKHEYYIDLISCAKTLRAGSQLRFGEPGVGWHASSHHTPPRAIPPRARS